MTDSFLPSNDLERDLLAAQQGELDEETFMHHLLAAQLFMPVLDRHQIGGFQDSKAAQPLTFTDENGTEVLVLFTSPERAKPVLHDFPGYEGGLLAEFTWILERTGAGVGIIINPQWPVGLEIAPEIVQQLAGAAE